MTTMQSASTPTAPIGPAFADPVMQSQAAFRVIMAALAEPGIWQQVPREVEAPTGLAMPAAVALLTLADFETPVWLPPRLRDGEASRWLRFHCSCLFTDSPADAAFAVVSGDDPSMPRLSDFSAGTDLFPDRSATVIVTASDQVGGIPIDLSGPGIDTTRRIAPAGLSSAFWVDAVANAKRYPLGVDLLLVDHSHVLGLPRSTQIVRGV